VQQGLDLVDGDLQHLGDLGVAVLRHLAQVQRLALISGQSRQAAFEAGQVVLGRSLPEGVSL